MLLLYCFYVAPYSGIFHSALSALHHLLVSIATFQVSSCQWTSLFLFIFLLACLPCEEADPGYFHACLMKPSFFNHNVPSAQLGNFSATTDVATYVFFKWSSNTEDDTSQGIWGKSQFTVPFLSYSDIQNPMDLVHGSFFVTILGYWIIVSANEHWSRSSSSVSSVSYVLALLQVEAQKLATTEHDK